MQHTIQNSIPITNIGLHSGKPVNMVIHPADENHGLVFRRTDMDEGKNLIPVMYDHVTDTRMCTLVSNEHGARVGTIEHLMAALRACNVDNALIDIDASEVPIMDGSSIDFVRAIDAAGLKEQSAPRKAIKILKEVKVTEGDKIVTLSPSDVPVYAGRIEFPHAVIGAQGYELVLTGDNFRNDVANCRTFGFLKEAEALWAMGLGLGGSLDNAIILNDEGVMNPGGLRHPDEFIRHKMLDAVGDLHLAGMPILGRYYGEKGGHALNNAVLHALFADPSAFEIIRI